MRKFFFYSIVAGGLWSAFVPSGRAQSYTFTTIAGLAGTTGSADGTNSDARFNFPCELGVDAAGALYLSDLLNNTIRKITPVGTNWVVTTLAGLAGNTGWADGTNSDARFNRPNGVAVDLAGNVFVADHYNQTIRKITPVDTNWVVTTIAGVPGVRGHEDGTNDQASFYSPTGIAVDSADHLYVVDTANFTIRLITPVGTNWVVSTLAGTALIYGFLDGTNADAQFDYPNGISLDAGGTLFVADWGNNAIRQITRLGPDWVVTTIAGVSGLMGTNDGPGSLAMFNSPIESVWTLANDLLITDQSNHTIRRATPVKPEWMVSTEAGVPMQFGAADGSGTNARFYKPWGIAMDRAGRVFVADYRNQTIRMGMPLLPPAPPALQIALAGDGAVVSWPADATNYVLRTTEALAPGASWTPLTNGIVLSGGRFFFTNSLNGGAAFFQLRLK